MPPEEDAMRLFTIGALLLFVTATSASAQQSTLDRELLVTNPPQPLITANCDPAGISTISYSASGAASGAYSGTYIETAVATIGPQPLPGIQPAPVTSFSASFVITSGSTVITGTRELTDPGNLATNLGYCTPSLQSFGAATTYEGRIQTSSGAYTDRGVAAVALNSQYPSNTLYEPFYSDLDFAEPVPTEVGKVTGGGALKGLDSRFGFVVQRKVVGGTISGEWQYVNTVTGEIVHSLAFTDLSILGNTATFAGYCRNESAPSEPCMFKVAVQDNGQGANAPPDTFTVDGVGFNGGSGAVIGNITIHK
jgi:hypothetical protein